MARVVNPNNLDVEDDDALFAGALSQGLIWIEDDDDIHLSHVSQIEYLESSNQTNLHTLKGHIKRINAIEVRGDFIISASDDRTIRVWNWQTGEHIHMFTGHRGSIRSFVVSGDFVISASDDKTVRVSNWVTGEWVRTLKGHAQKVSELDIDGEIVVTASLGEVWIWNWQTGILLQKLSRLHLGAVGSVAIDGDFVLSASPDLVIVRNWKSGETLHTLKLNVNAMIAVDRIGVDKKFFVYRDFDAINVWNWKTGIRLDETDLLREENIHITSKPFVIYSNIYVYSRKLHKWCCYGIDAAYDKIALVEGYIYIITTDHGGWIYLVRMNPSLKRTIDNNSDPKKPTLPATYKTSTKQKISGISQNAERKRNIVTEILQDYTTDDVLKAARDFVHMRNEAWVNFSRVSQYLHERFSNLKPKQLGRPNKNYTSLLKFFADFPSDFELRQDLEKQGLFWIRLAQKR